MTVVSTRIIDWRDEGVTFNAAQGENTVPVYRLYNKRTGQHLLTMSRVEYDHLGAIGWNREGEAFRVDPNGSVDVYRVYNPNTGEHLWTSDRTEYEHLGTIGWQLENIAWKGTNA